MIVHAEIQYRDQNDETVHSDICPANDDSDNLSDPEYRKFLHACLDEWLNESRGTGGFYIKAETHKWEV